MDSNRYEYKVVEINNSNGKLTEENEKILNLLGIEEWELIAVIGEIGGLMYKGSSGRTALFLKRKKSILA